MEDIVINIEPIMQHVDFIVAVIGICLILIIVVFMLGRGYQDKLNHNKDIHNKDKDVEVVTEAFAKIGEVKNGTANETILNAQNVENNKELFSHDKKLIELEERIEYLEFYINQINCNIQDQLKEILNKIS